MTPFRSAALVSAAIALSSAHTAGFAQITAVSQSAVADGHITPKALMSLDDMREVALSPDGRTALFTVQSQISTFTPERAAIWSIPIDKSAPAHRFIFSSGISKAPHWAPDGRSVAFLSDRANPLAKDAEPGLSFKLDPRPDVAGDSGPSESVLQLWRIPADGGEAVPLTAFPGGVNDFEWSPDGRSIAFVAADPPTAAEHADQQAKRDWSEVDHYKHFSRLWILDLNTGNARRISPEGLNVSAVDWGPDGRTLALTVAPTPDINDFFYHSRIVLIPREGGQISETGMESAAGAPHWSPDGRKIVYQEILKTGTPRHLRGGISVALRIYDAASHKITRIGDDYRGLISEPHWTADSRGLNATSFEATRSRLVKIDAASGAILPGTKFPGEIASLATSHDGRTLVVAGNSPERPADLWLVRNDTFEPITNINPQVAHWALGRVEEISWKSSIDDRTIYGVLITPPGFRPGTPIKTVTQIHGGPEWAWWSGWMGSWHEWGQMLASHGFAVFLPNPRGSDGQGADFARAVMDDWGGADFQDVQDGLDYLVARKIADPNRLGIGGWSYGGFMSAWAVTHSHRFKTAIIGAGVTDLLSMARTTDTPDFPWDYFGDVPTNIAKYDAASSVRFLDKVEVPVLILHGEADTRVPIEQGRHFYEGLRLLGKPAEMVSYPREPHWFREREHQTNVQQRVLDWFQRYL